MKEEDVDIVVGLVGNPNVGKSAFFHQVTGIGVTVSNYPGTTVEVAEGRTHYGDRTIEVIDLPGVYSLGAVAEDERVARNEILEGEIDVIIDVLDASNLERNLYLALQLIELNVPIVIALNQYDVAMKRGIKVDPDILSEKLGIPVIETVATKGENVSEAFSKAIEVGEKGLRPDGKIELGKDLEEIVEELTEIMEEKFESTPHNLPPRALAIKLLEGDEEIMDLLLETESGEKIVQRAREAAQKIKDRHGEAAAFRIA
ncbi:MAG: FeoB small GTPase domain-containing protein, partial [Candidatus Aenigmatarchaeota archaeon]